jgi:hypothetical protein
MGRPTCARWRSRAPSLVRLGKALARRGRSRHATTHEATLTADNHLAYVEAFVLQLGALGQQAAILSLLSSCARGFRQHTIAYKPPGARQLHAALDVARWVGMRLDGDLAHAYVRSRRAGHCLIMCRPTYTRPTHATHASPQVLERARRADMRGRDARVAVPASAPSTHSCSMNES